MDGQAGGGLTGDGMANATINWQAKITVETGILTRYLHRMAEKTHRGMGEVLREQAPVAARYIASVTAPMAGYHPGKITKADHDAGRNAIKWDLLGRNSGEGIVHIAPRAVIKKFAERFGDVQEKGAPKGWEQSRTVAAYRDLYDPNGTKLAEVHQQARSKRTGRVSRANRQKAEIKRVGTWKVLDKLFVTRPAFNRYLKTVQARVGGMKGGWYRAAMSYGKTSGWPAWVTGARGGAGSTTDRSKMPGMPHVILHNLVNYAATRADTATAIARGLREMRVRLARSVRFKLQNTWR